MSEQIGFGPEKCFLFNKSQLLTIRSDYFQKIRRFKYSRKRIIHTVQVLTKNWKNNFQKMLKIIKKLTWMQQVATGGRLLSSSRPFPE